MDHDLTPDLSGTVTADELAASLPLDFDDAFEQAAPPVPITLEDTGLSDSLVEDLLLKMMYDRGAMAGQKLRDELKLPFAILDEVLVDLQQRRFVEVRGTTGQSRATYIFDLTSAGRERSRELLATNGYVGPAPVPLERYTEWVESQTIQGIHVTAGGIRDGFSHLVYPEHFLDQLGPAINSGLSLFLYGHSGNGKTTIAEAIAQMLGGAVYLPYALEVAGQLVVLYDPVYHHPADEDEDGAADDPFGDHPLFHEAQPHDARYARIRRPVVFVGGELQLEQLDLQYDPDSRIYQAPSHVKANGGVFIIDDFGRQHVRPRDLLNRWMVPLEKRVDYLAFKNGYKFPIPFDCMLIFATNLNPLELVDEAFLRRIRYKILVESPNRDQYDEIFRRCCESRDIVFDRSKVDQIYDGFYQRLQMAPRGCHPRDIVDTICNCAKYEGIPAALTDELVSQACRTYFLDMPGVGSIASGAGAWSAEEDPDSP
ncbi:MAG: ATP-binding protein [Gemmatimonadota bacterium]|jgi:predicted ATPase with chaperone activity